MFFMSETSSFASGDPAQQKNQKKNRGLVIEPLQAILCEFYVCHRAGSVSLIYATDFHARHILSMPCLSIYIYTERASYTASASFLVTLFLSFFKNLLTR